MADDEEPDEPGGGADPVLRLSGELAWDGSDHRRPVVLCRGEPVASFEYRAPGERRVLTRLEFLGRRRSVDVTVQPDTPRVAACDGVVALPVRPLHVPGPVQAIAVGSDDEFRYPDAALRLHGADSGGHFRCLTRERQCPVATEQPPVDPMIEP